MKAPPTFFSAQVALNAIHACRVAMKYPEHEQGDHDIAFYDDEKTGTQAVAIESESDITIAYRATETGELKDILTDIRFHKIKLETERHLGEMHRGFLGGTLSLFDPLYDRAETVHASGKNIRIAGHSLGAAEGHVFANIAASRGLPIKSIYTFGSPRSHAIPASWKYNERLFTRTYSFINHRDPVCCLPPSQWNYKHVGQLCYFDRSGNPHWSPNALAVSANRLVGLVADLRTDGIQTFLYHSLELYEELIAYAYSP